MDQPGTIAAVMARLDFQERRITALETTLGGMLAILERITDEAKRVTAPKINGD